MKPTTKCGYKTKQKTRMNYDKLIYDLLRSITAIMGKCAFVDTIQNSIMYRDYVNYEHVIKMIDAHYSDMSQYSEDGFEGVNYVERLTRITVNKYITKFWELKSIERDKS